MGSSRHCSNFPYDSLEAITRYVNHTDTQRTWFIWLQEDHYLAHHEEAQSSLSHLGKKILDGGQY